MLVGITGKMGSGKTLSMTIFGCYLAKALNLPLYANYELLTENYSAIKTMEDLWNANKGIVMLDEIWISMDSRLWKDNVQFTRWINQTRKKGLLVMYTSQSISQVEMRVRNATDILIYCEKKEKKYHKLTFIDWQYRNIGKRYLIEDPQRFYKLYDTFEIVWPIKMKKTANYEN